jgi:hypothetical protein
MIFIDLTNFIPDDEWSYEAWHLNAELLSKTNDAERHAFIDSNRDFWGVLKSQFPYNDKCWYSEAKESVSVYEIEHFRPIKSTIKSKSILKKLKTFREAIRSDWTAASKYKGGGYWWLAFNHHNFRNCGKRINQIKSSRFPLEEGSFIAYRETDDCLTEINLLLDPTHENDPALLTFDPDGKARPTITDENELNYLRAVISIETYGLNDIDTLVKHRATKWSDCYKAIRRAAEKYSAIEQSIMDGNIENYYKLFDDFMDFVENDIKPAIDPASEFSSVAKACVLSYASYSWIKEYILAA